MEDSSSTKDFTDPEPFTYDFKDPLQSMSTKEIEELLKNLKDSPDVDRSELLEVLLHRKHSDPPIVEQAVTDKAPWRWFQPGIASGDNASQSVMIVMLAIMVLIIAFFGYKLYKSLIEKERKKEEKKKLKLKKKK